MYNEHKMYIQYNKKNLYDSTTNNLYVIYNKHKFYVQYNEQTVCTVQ